MTVDCLLCTTCCDTYAQVVALKATVARMEALIAQKETELTNATAQVNS
jgi:hypothetical protein